MWPFLLPLPSVAVEARIAPHTECLQLRVGFGRQPTHIAPEVEARRPTSCPYRSVCGTDAPLCSLLSNCKGHCSPGFP